MYSAVIVWDMLIAVWQVVSQEDHCTHGSVSSWWRNSGSFRDILVPIGFGGSAVLSRKVCETFSRYLSAYNQNNSNKTAEMKNFRCCTLFLRCWVASIDWFIINPRAFPIPYQFLFLHESVQAAAYRISWDVIFRWNGQASRLFWGRTLNFNYLF